jgi:ABC-type nitrate/sulfonate/bicarbonate transport system substrate-binding protein
MTPSSRLRRLAARSLRKPAIAATGIALVLVASACSSSSTGGSAGGSLQSVTVGVSGATGNTAPIFVGVDAGVFKRYGLNVQVKILTPTASSAAVASGTVDIGGDGPNMVAAVLASKSGAKVIFTNGITAFYLATQSSISSITGLKGKTIATTTPGGGADTAARTALLANDLKPDKDVKIIYVSQNSAALASLQAGKVQAAVVSPPTTIQAETQFHLKTIDIGDYVLPSVYAASGGFAAKHPDLVTKFIEGYMAATQLAKTDKAASESAFKKYLGIKDQTQLDGTWEQYKDRWAASPFPTGDLKDLLAGLKPPSTADPATLIDNSYIKKIDQSTWVVPSGFPTI